MYWFFLFFLSICGWTLEAASRSKEPPPSALGGSYEALPAIGVRTFTYQDEKRSRPVVVELWYPSDTQQELDQPKDVIWIHPKEMRDVPCAESVKERPLIMMSHGHGGDRRERSWLADRLVRSGFVVASVDHYGNTSATFDLLASLKFWERGKDVSFAIDQLLQEDFLFGRVDPARIGFVGYSLGGMTGLGLAGAQVGAIERVLDQIMTSRKEILPELVANLDLQEARQSLKDERIRAMLLICPASFAYPPQSLQQITIPIGLVVAPHDEVLPFKQHAELIIQHVAPARIKMMRNETSHYSFLNRVSEEGKKFLKKHVYRDPLYCDKAVIHREVGLFAADFFQEFLP